LIGGSQNRTVCSIVDLFYSENEYRTGSHAHFTNNLQKGVTLIITAGRWSSGGGSDD
jgi:hypothetical protein